MSTQTPYLGLLLYDSTDNQSAIEAIQKIFTLIKNGQLVLFNSPFLTNFYTLEYFDQKTLATEDLQTIGQLDYTTV